MKVTIYDVAKQANVSIATVSKVINNRGRISQETRARVLAAMKELNYHPSAVASALTGKLTNTIGLLIPDISNPFFSEIARHIEAHAHKLGLSVIMCSTDYNEEKEAKYVQLLLRKKVDGLILSSGFRKLHLLENMVNEMLPIAMIAEHNRLLKINSVSIDDYKGGEIATRHLLTLGHMDIGIIAENVKSSDLRIKGFTDALHAAGIEINKANILQADASIEKGRLLTQQLLKLPKKPTAIFAMNDLLAVGAFQVIQENGLHIPEDISIVSFDNTILARNTVPALTSIAQPIQQMGQKVVEQLINEISNPKHEKQQILFPPELIIRNSTASPKQR